MLKKNEEYIVKIEELGCNGEGVARIDGRAVFVPYAIVGEEVKVKILKAKTSFAFAKLIEVLTPSADRVQEVCPVYKKCGGCNIQHIEYNKQLEWKSANVSECFRKIADIFVDVPKTVASNLSYRYRNKVQLPVRHTKNGNVIGFFRENSHDIIPIDDCAIQREWVKDLIACFKEFIARSGIACYDDETGKGLLKHIVAREVSGKMIIVAVITEKKLKCSDMLVDILQDKFKDFSLFLNINQLGNNVVLGREFRLVCGMEKTVSNEGGILMPMGPESFMQVNDFIREEIYKKVCDLAGKNTAVIDAYSGAGFLTARLALQSDKVYGIECVQEAVDCANKLAKDNGLDGKIINECGLCEDVLPRLIPSVTAQYGSATVVLDPPRKGCDVSVINAILSVKPQKIIYVSCNPSTLARDVGLLVGTLKYDGAELKKTKSTDYLYNIDFIQPFDMFSQSRHVESLVYLTRK